MINEMFPESLLTKFSLSKDRSFLKIKFLNRQPSDEGDEEPQVADQVMNDEARP